MSPMSDQPITLAVLTTALVQFHRDVILPDLHKVVEASEGRLRNEMYGLHDSVLQNFARLETEYVFLKVAVSRLEERMTAVETRMGVLETQYTALEAQYRELLAGFHRLEEKLARVEARLARAERNGDDLVAAQDKEPLRAEVADLRARMDGLQEQMRALAERVDRR